MAAATAVIGSAATAVIEAGVDGRDRGPRRWRRTFVTPLESHYESELTMTNKTELTIYLRKYVLHCNENRILCIPRKGIAAASVSVSTFMSMSDFYIPRIDPLTIFSSSRIGRQIMEYINRSQTH
jgi:hypothetical protein